jgi:hypothetical protein
MAGGEHGGAACVVQIEFQQRLTVGGSPVLVMAGTVPDGACSIQLRAVAGRSDEPAEAVGVQDVARKLVRLVDGLAVRMPGLRPLTLEAARKQVTRAVERDALPHSGDGRDCRIQMMQADAFIVRYIMANVIGPAASRVGDVEDADNDEPTEAEQPEIELRISQERTIKRRERGCD